MKGSVRSGFYRITIYRPSKMKAPDLSTLALVSYACDVVDGFLQRQRHLSGEFEFTGTCLEGNRDLIFASGPIVCIQAPYILTHDTLYQLLRVPRTANRTCPG